MVCFGLFWSSYIADLVLSLSDLGHYLSCTVAAESLQVLFVGQVSGQPAILKGNSRIDEGGGSTVVVHKERLRNTEKTNDI